MKRIASALSTAVLSLAVAGTAGCGNPDADISTDESELRTAPFCTTNADCPAWKYCSVKEGMCGGRGRCKAKPQACTMIYQPVCGCDGLNYGSECMAQAAGVSIANDGPCGVGEFCGGIAAIACPDGLECVRDGSYPDAGGTCQRGTVTLP